MGSTEAYRIGVSVSDAELEAPSSRFRSDNTVLASLPTARSWPFWTPGLITEAMVAQTAQPVKRHTKAIELYDSTHKGGKTLKLNEPPIGVGLWERGYRLNTSSTEHVVRFNHPKSNLQAWSVAIPRSLQRSTI